MSTSVDKNCKKTVVPVSDSSADGPAWNNLPKSTTERLTHFDEGKVFNESPAFPSVSFAQKSVSNNVPIAPRLPHASSKDTFLSGRGSKACSAKHLSDLKVELDNEALWKIFDAETHEMKITNNGRPLFPALQFRVSGLLRNEKYILGVNIVNLDSVKYRFNPKSNKWLDWTTDQSDVTSNTRRYYEHPSSPALGEYWFTGVIMFDKLRLTNNLNRKEKHMIQVSSLRKYRVQVVVAKTRCTQCQHPHVRMVEFPLTDFIAVTGYRNSKITQLKIEKNPFSAQFRGEYKILKAERMRKRETNLRSEKMKTKDTPTVPIVTRLFSMKESSTPSSLVTTSPVTLTTPSSCGIIPSPKPSSPSLSCYETSSDSLTSVSSLEESSTRSSCCRTSSDTLTGATSSVTIDDTMNNVYHKDFILYHQKFPQSYQAIEPDLSQFQIPEMNLQYPALMPPDFQTQEQYTYGYDFEDYLHDQSYNYCNNSQDFTSPIQNAEWNNVYWY